jgi:HNH endonuclease
MPDIVTDLARAIDRLHSIKASFPFSEEEAQAHFDVSVLLRRIQVSLPNSRLKREAMIEFVTKFGGTDSAQSLFRLSQRIERDVNLDVQEYLRLENQQNGRCALCGIPLVRKSVPHIDHKIPVAFGGSSQIHNLQLLCSSCNLGKSSSLHWIMLSPCFADSDGHEASARVRYCVLQRYHGKCAVPDCENSSRLSKMYVSPKIPLQDGGRIIFDNLETLCESHYHGLIRELQERAAENMRNPGARFKFGFSK